MASVEASGKTVDEAVEKALAKLGAGRDEVEVEVLSEGKGMLGRGQAKVRVRLRDHDGDSGELDDGEDGDQAADELGDDDQSEEAEGDEAVGEEGEPIEDEAEYAAQMLDHMLALMGIEADVSIRDAETPGDGVGVAKAVLDIEGDDLGILIGRRGETLGYLQYLLNLMVQRQLGEGNFFTIDVEGYRRRRERQLTTLARRMADQVRRTRKAVTLEPMPANERRIVHIALAEDRQVATESSGEGEDRAITILPR
jgi:spoIIIJ-associated protein